MGMTPKEVVEAYNYELWNKQNYELGAQIIADKVTRYYPGKTQTMTREEALQRVKDSYANTLPTVEFKIPKLLAEGEYVTLFWEMFAKTMDGDDMTYSSIEVFRVVDGKITEFWNPTYTEGSNGVWG